MNVPYTYPLLIDEKVISFGYGQNCIYLISTVLNRLRGWPLFINDFIIFSATTAGANGLYNASRTLHALAGIPDVWPDYGPVHAFRRRLEKTSYGVPHAAVFISAGFGMLGFLAVNEDSQVVSRRQIEAMAPSTLMDSTGPWAYGTILRHVAYDHVRPVSSKFSVIRKQHTSSVGRA